MKAEAIDEFLTHFKETLDNGSFIKITLSKKRSKQRDLKSITGQLITIKQERMLSFLLRYPTKDIVANYSLNDGIAYVSKQVPSNFLQGLLQTKNADYQLLINKKKNARINRLSSSAQDKISKHNRTKKTWISTENNIYLEELGIIQSEGIIVKDKYSKFRQINKFVEIVSALIAKANLPKEIIIADMGCGKGYLTFALYDYLTNEMNFDVQMEGIEMRDYLVEYCNNISQKCNFSGLQFKLGQIGEISFPKLDILIALHACDTATDDAIAQGIKSNAQVIICSPCCHHALRKQMKSTGVLSILAKYGIEEERIAEIATDNIRALLLEIHGYKTNIMEFIATEHTAKNLLITAIKRKEPISNLSIIKELNDLKMSLGIDKYYLETIL